MRYSFKKGLIKAVMGVLLVAGPIVLQAMPAEWMDITVGGLLLLSWNFIKVKYLAI